MKNRLFATITLVCLWGFQSASADSETSVTYLGNEALLFSNNNEKVLFDPFFHNDYGSYQLVPEDIRKAIFSNQAPYDEIDLIVISHAHGDHFAADDLASYLKANASVTLLAPNQAVEKVVELESEITKQITSLELEYGDQPVNSKIGDITIDSVRIPHAGWPQRKEISNLVHRVTLSDGKTIIHMGDADPNDEHFKPLISHWQKQQSDIAFPPFWFFISEQGPMILKERINSKESIGVHVPIDVPQALLESGERFFTKPGKKINLD